MRNIEFYTPDSKLCQKSAYMRKNAEWIPIDNISDASVVDIIDLIRQSKQGTLALKRLQERGITSNRAKLSRFIKCNWGSLDRVPDICENGTLNFEKVECDCRTTCKDRGIVCIKK